MFLTSQPVDSCTRSWRRTRATDRGPRSSRSVQTATQLAVGYPTLNYDYGYVTLYNTHGWRREYTVMQTDTGEVSSVAFSPDGTRLAVGLEDGTAGVWSLITRDQLESYAGMTSAVTAIDFLRGGQTALTVANDGIGRVWRAAAPTERSPTVPGERRLPRARRIELGDAASQPRAHVSEYVRATRRNAAADAGRRTGEQHQ